MFEVWCKDIKLNRLKIYISWWQRIRKFIYVSDELKWPLLSVSPNLLHKSRLNLCSSLSVLVICEISVLISVSFHWPCSAYLFLYCHKVEIWSFLWNHRILGCLFPYSFLINRSWLSRIGSRFFYRKWLAFWFSLNLNNTYHSSKQFFS